jgi:hypothetical protein
MKKIIATLFIFFLLTAFSDPYTIKRISDANFRYEFYTTQKENNVKNNRLYYSFKGGSVHATQGGFSGELLNGLYKKHFHSNQLAESGKFKKGLKVKLWKTWHENGNIETIQRWSDGLQTGTYYRYDENSVLVEKGNYKFGKKNGKWIDLIKKDTLIYKSGKIYTPKPTLTKEEKKVLKEEKKKQKELKKAAAKEKEKSKTNNKQKVSTKDKQKATKDKTPKNEKTVKKENFFKRLFGKKTKNDKSS